MYIKKIAAILLVYSAYFSTAHATIIVEPPTQILPQINNAESAGTSIAALITYAIQLTGVLAIIAITWGGIRILLAAWDEEKMKKSRSIMIYAVVGLVIAGLAYAVVQFITNLNLSNIS